MVRQKTYKESLKGLEFDVQHANTLAAYHPREHDGVHFQMRLGYSAFAPFFLFLLKWTDCSLAGALGLMHILIYKVGVNGHTSMGTHEKRASLREFYGCLLPSLQQLQGGLTEFDISRQKRICALNFEKRHVVLPRSLSSSERATEREIEGECGICFEHRAKVVLPDCLHDMCLKCYKDWRNRCYSCPFCRESLKRVESSDLWVFIEETERMDPATLTRNDLQRLLLYIDRLPIAIADNVLAIYDARYR